MAFKDIFYQEVLNKKQEFENMSQEQQHEFSNFVFGSDDLNCELTFLEVSKAIDRAKCGKAYLEIPNEVMKNKNAKSICTQIF